MRIIRGKARGRRLRSVPGEITRPVTDRVKEALFNILGADIEDARFLDLFAGTGSVGIEALSCGASFVRFVDVHRAAIDTIRVNLTSTNLAYNTQLVHKNALVMLAGTPNDAFDYIYIAPPQYKNLWIDALQSLDAQPGWLSEDAWIIIQIDPKEYEELTLQNLEEFDQRRYGDTLLVFYKKV